MRNATPKQYTTTRFGPKPSGCQERVAATRPAGRLIPLYWIISLESATLSGDIAHSGQGVREQINRNAEYGDNSITVTEFDEETDSDGANTEKDTAARVRFYRGSDAVAVRFLDFDDISPTEMFDDNFDTDDVDSVAVGAHDQIPLYVRTPEFTRKRIEQSSPVSSIIKVRKQHPDNRLRDIEELHKIESSVLVLSKPIHLCR